MNDQTSSPWWQHSRNQTIAIGLLVGVMLFVVFALPNLVEPVQIDSKTLTKDAPSASTKTPDSPFADAQLARERKQAQEILGQVLQLQDQLEGQQIDQWGAQAYQTALETAAKGDELYRQREFSLAQENYKSTLAQLQKLKQDADIALEQQLQLGQAALNEKDANTATQAFTLALAIDPNSQVAQAGIESAKVLDDILALLRKGRLEEKTNHWRDALESYQQALNLDSRSAIAQTAHSTLKAKIRERDFTDAMSRGYKALDQQDFTAAKSAFMRAGEIKPGDTSVALGLQQVESQSIHTSIQNKIIAARKAEADEQWQLANNLYIDVLATDSTVVDALVGKLRTDARAALEKRVQTILANKLALNKPENLANAQTALAELEALGKVGARTVNQRENLRSLIEQVEIPRQVLLQSDNLTQVTIYHVGRIGAFDEHTLALKPGKYVAVGIRPGYRDVREEFVVELDANSVVVSVRCTEKIALGG
ncbi:hypothetical protein QWY82_15755 [Simiduia curdlanivorans]|uniref:Tetratricopeptide repeat protein n=1 Tax=Simiduia curdlanivorans TaxID=1492769 RepID=A0ABV8V5K2_9GAMM|nr:hypothetical protein [Simiduia curdlanivorans]MDN3640251.1 hypothetical protein [Simiduia curdlanivorans]